MVPVAVSGRERLRRDHWPPADGAMRRESPCSAKAVLEMRANPAASPMNVVALNIGFFLCNLHGFVGEGSGAKRNLERRLKAKWIKTGVSP